MEKIRDIPDEDPEENLSIHEGSGEPKRVTA